MTLNAEAWGGEESPKGLVTQGYSYDVSNASLVDLRMKPPLQYMSLRKLFIFIIKKKYLLDHSIKKKHLI